MKCSKEIAEKVKKYQELQNEASKLYEEIKDYFEENLGADGFCTPFITDKPTGVLQDCGDEYCDQRCVAEDWYEGEYYHKIEGSDKYVGYSYSM